jgi:hypothetical protein
MASHAREPEPRKPVGTLYRRGAKGKCNRQHHWQSLPLSLSRHHVTRKRPTFFSLARRTLHPVWEYPSLVFKAAGTRRRLFPIGVQCSAIIITLRAHCGNNRRFPIRLSAENVVEGTPWFIQRLKSAERMLTYLHRRGVNVKKNSAEERLEQGLEESMAGSDPVSATQPQAADPNAKSESED